MGGVAIPIFQHETIQVTEVLRFQPHPLAGGDLRRRLTVFQ
jgi:hypothetical protein